MNQEQQCATHQCETHPRHALDPVASFEPVPRPARVALEWDGRRFAEIDPSTGYVLTVGTTQEH